MTNSEEKASGLVDFRQNQLELYQSSGLQFQIPQKSIKRGLSLYVSGIDMQAARENQPIAIVLLEDVLVLCPLIGQGEFFAISFRDIKGVGSTNLTGISIMVPTSIGPVPATPPIVMGVEVAYTIPSVGLRHTLKWAVNEPNAAKKWEDGIIAALNKYKQR